MKYDYNPIPVLFSDEELATHVRDIFSRLETNGVISFNNICSQLIHLARREGKLESDTQYTSSEISRKDQIRVSSILWDMILDRKIFTAFGSHLWFGRGQEDTIFVSR